MTKALVIVESPAKAKTINKYLGKNYVVKSSVGHVRDLPVSGSAASKTTTKSKAATKTAKKKTKKTSLQKKKEAQAKLTARMGIDPTNNWEAHYAILPGKEKVLNDLKTAAEKADIVYLATDLDREGEAIAWHLAEAIGGEKERFKRVTFTEITKKAIQEAFKSPSEINMNMVNSQQARRFLDRVVGYLLSPLLWSKVARGLSAGRVQSVAVRLISGREKEIHAFKPEEYWEIYTDLNTPKGVVRAQCSKHNGQGFRPSNKADTDKAVTVLESKPYHLAKREDKPTKSKPSAPYITSTLQQAASVKLSFGVKKTMILAQQLYEAGHITYMRTDSTNLSKEAVEDCRAFIKEQHGDKYLPESPVTYSSKKGAQEAHEAIRPSNMRLLPKELEDNFEKDAVRLYDLIWRQFVACQMTPAQFDSTVLIFNCEGYELRARGRVLKFEGFMKVQPPVKKKGDEDLTLPDLKEGDDISMKKVDPSQHFTKPPPRFTEASLVRELEKKGIGRPSTYASIITTIQDRGYVRVDKRRFQSLKMGDIVTDRLTESFGELMNYDFTANMEAELDKIASGEIKWKNLLNGFYSEFTEKIESASENMRGNDPTPTNVECPACSREMAIRTARTGVFMSCSGYALPPKERCKETINLVAGEEAVSIIEDDDEGDLAEVQSKRRCDKCDTAMDSYLIDEERKLHVCGSNPDCDGFFVEEGKFKIKGYEGPIIQCDKCGADMQLRTGRFGKYFACTKAPDCKNTRKLLRNGEAAPPRCDPVPMPELPCEKSDGFFILRDGAAGIFLASNQFPKSRETRKPLVEDLVRHKDEIDPKYQHLTEAPAIDPEGNPSIIRYTRKTKEHYVMTEKDNKATGWSAHFEEGDWIVKITQKGKSKKKVEEVKEP